MRSLQNTDTFQRQARPFELKHTSLSLSRPFALDTSQIMRHDDVKISKYRGERWELREKLRSITGLKRLKACGKTPIGPLVTLHGEKGGKATYSGLSTCSSVWACPVHSAAISHVRQSQISQILEHYCKEQGFYASMVTLTMRHNSSQSLTELWSGLSHAFRKTFSGSRYRTFKTQAQVVGYIRATELTYGDPREGGHGFHLHHHICFISKQRPDEILLEFKPKKGKKEIVTPKEWVAERWGNALAEKGIDFLRVGMDWQVAKKGDEVALGRYVGKLGGAGMSGEDGLSKEMTLGQWKQARGVNRTMWQLARDAVEKRDKQLIAVWREYEKVSKGKKATTFSRGLTDSISDAEIIEQAEKPNGDAVLCFSKRNWYKVREHGAIALCEVLESCGIYTARAWCDIRGIEYVLPDDLEKPPKRE